MVRSWRVESMRQGVAANLRTRAPLLPKELLVPVCWRLALVLSVMCTTALGIRLAALYRMGKLGRWSRAKPSFPVNGTHFFLDIGLGNNADDEESHTKRLEENGWRGVCVDPFPDTSRSCHVISMPVAAQNGEQVQVADCTSKSSPLQVVLSARILGRPRTDCPNVERSAVSIVDLMKLSKAPRVIDYVSLDTHGSELAILQRFPFDGFCVRAWTVRRHDEADTSDGIKKLLVLHSCRVKEAGSSYWARCKCSGFSESLLARRAVARKDVVAEARAGHLLLSQKHKRRRRAPAMVPTAMLQEEEWAAAGGGMLGGPTGLGGSLLRRPSV